MNEGSVRNAAKSALNNLGRTSMSSKGFTQGEINAIADAIVAAIKSYDEQKNKES